MATLPTFTTLQLELAAAHLRWETEFPGSTAALQSLREAVITADCIQLHSRHALLSFQVLLEYCRPSQHPCDSNLLRHIDSLKRSYQRDCRHFTIALKELQHAHAQHHLINAKAPKTAPSRPSGPVKPGKVFHEQLVEVNVIDGHTVTSVACSAAYWIAQQIWSDHTVFVRRFAFPNAVVPHEYDYLLTDKGVRYDPAPQFAITYSGQEFERLCRLEVDTGSAHLLDGERLLYQRRE